MHVDPTLTKAEIFTHRHRYSGMVMTRGRRLADLLNDSSTEVLEVRDVRVSQPANAHSEPIECPHLHLKKDAILLAFPCGGHEAPMRRLFSLVEKNQFLARVVLPGHVLLGTMHLSSRATPWLLMLERGTEPSFLPITNVTVFFDAADAQPMETRVVIFQRRFIESIHLAERSLTAQSLLDLVQQPVAGGSLAPTPSFAAEDPRVAELQDEAASLCAETTPSAVATSEA